MLARDWLADVERTRGSYVDFYPAAALLRAGYVAVNTMGENAGQLGDSMQVTAQCLCQICLKPGESFQIEGCERESWWNSGYVVFLTADGLLKLEELSNRTSERLWTVGVAVLSAALSAAFTAWAI